MTASSDSLVLITYALAREKSIGHCLAVARAMEQALPGLRMEWEVSEQGIPRRLTQRDTWLAEAERRGEFPLLCNGNESHPITVAGWDCPAGISPGGQPQFEVHVGLPLDKAVIAVGMDLLQGVAEGACALWGHASPHELAVEASRQTRQPYHAPVTRVAPRLPVIELPQDIPSPEIPGFLGWLNYWSAATAQIIGFPHPTRDADLLSRARRTAKGGWVVQLTEAPLDLERPEDLEALLQAYERFPKIGGRVR